MPIPSRRRLFGLVLGFISLNLLNCGAAHHPANPPPSLDSEHCGGLSCNTVGDCTANPPVCANLATIACPTQTPRECVYSLKISAACPCLEHDVRLCSVPGTGAPGVQICTKTNATTTAWASCVACPSCTQDQ